MSANFKKMQADGLFAGMTAGRAGMGAVSMVGTAAGAGLMSYGLMNEDVGMATAGGFLAGAAPVLGMAAMTGVGATVAVPAALVAGGVTAFGSYQAAKAARDSAAGQRRAACYFV